ncbi:MAG: MBL fold metallo-hydrolase [Spirochaetes bacterium]|nr:MBL fold metallo-hydrolase [Spirochaetota bacterium]
MKLIGVRGSLPTPSGNKEYRHKIRNILLRAVEAGLNDVTQINNFIDELPENLKFNYGGNTTCVTVTSKGGNLYILDCGSGLRGLGDELLSTECGKGKGYLKIFISHVHWDHIQGLPFFKPMYISGNILEFYSPYETLEENLKAQMDSPFFPAPFQGTASTKKYKLLKAGESIQLEDDLFVDCHPLNHPGGCVAYRFREGKKIFIFATDAEFTGETLERAENQSHFFLNSDILILDSQYTLDEHFGKFDWGHTSYTIAVNCAIRWGVKHLILTHHDPGNDDKKLRNIHSDAIQHRNDMKLKIPMIHIAREGMTFSL